MNCPNCRSQMIEPQMTSEHIEMKGVTYAIERYQFHRCKHCNLGLTEVDQYEANWRQARKEAA